MTLFGRSHELQRLAAALDRARQGDGGLVLITGEIGIGKSALARALAARAAESGVRPVWGRCWEAGPASPYWPWTQVFRALEIDPLREARRAQGADPAERRFQLFEAVAGALAAAARRQPLAILLEDLHAADVPSLLLLLLVAQRAAGLPLLLLGTAREAEARSSPEVAGALARLAREGELLQVARLGRADVAAWVGGSAPSGLSADAVFRLTEGNPLFVVELLRAAGPRLTEGMAAALDAHLDRVPPAAREILSAAAILGREFETRATAELAGVEHSRVAGAANAAATSALVEELGAGRFQFTHVLLRERLIEQLAPRVRAELHWRAGLLAEARQAEPAVIARHLLEGVDAGSPERAAEAVLLASAEAMHGLAFEAARDLAARALGVLGPAPSRLRCRLLLAEAEALIRTGALQPGRERCLQAAELARRLPAPEELGQAALTYGAELATAAVEQPLVALLEEALAAAPPADAALRARLGARLAAALTPPGDEAGAERIVEMAHQAIAQARELGDREVLLYVLLLARSGMGYMVPSDERFALGSEIVALARERDHRLTLLTAGPSFVVSLRERGRRVAAGEHLAELARIDAGLGSSRSQWRVPMLRAALAMFDGELDEAAARGDEALSLAERGGAAAARVLWAQQRIALALARGAPDRIAPEGDRVLSALGGNPMLRPYRAWVLAALGRLHEARAELQEGLGAQHWLPTLLIAAEACTLLRDRRAAARVRARLAARALGAHFFCGGLSAAFALGPTERILGDLAGLLGLRAEARRQHAAAAELCRSIGAAPFLRLSLAALEPPGGMGQAQRPGGDPDPTAASGPAVRVPLLRREGDLWLVEAPSGSTFRVKHSKGLGYLSELLARPGEDIHVLALLGLAHPAGDAGPIIDRRAASAYRRRVADLQDELDEADRLGHTERAARARAEMEALAVQLAGAIGLGGRNRRAASDVERARINVQRRLRGAIAQLARHDAELGRELAGAVRTGTACSYRPWS